jgi:hypothetical protein
MPLWNCADGLLAAQVGQACEQRRDVVTQLVFELFPIAQLYALEAVSAYMQYYMAHPVSVQEVVDSVFEYSQAVADAVPSLEMARKEWEWRNGFFLWRQATPRHVKLLRQAGCQDLVDALAAREGLAL